MSIRIFSQTSKISITEIRTGRIPCTQDDSTIGRILFDFPNTLAKLVYALTVVRGVAIDIFGAKMSPLKAVHGSQVSFTTIC